VGRGFWAFKDVQEKRWDSPYKDWFHLSFDGNSNYNDGFWYEGWEGNYDLVKLNLRNPAVIDHILDKVNYWIDFFDIDGLRLDVAYCLDHDFLRRLREFTDGKKNEFFLLGEVLHGEYGRMLNEMHLHSLTNYQCYKGIYSSFNSANMFEIMHSLMRLFGPEDWTVCRGAHLLSFADNHDVTRIASILNDESLLPLVYTLVFGMPGIPCVYYGSEWGTKARKEEGDPALRVSFDNPEWNQLTDHIAKLAEIKKNSRALNYGGLRIVVLTNKQCIFERNSGDERIMVAINMDSNPYTAHFDAGCGQAKELISGTIHDFGGGSVLQPKSSEIWLMER
jgi:glycosidase